MLRQRGFMDLSIAAWGAIASAAVIASLSAALWVEGVRLDASRAETAAEVAKYNQFVGGVKAAGDKQNADAALRDLQALRNKERADEEQNSRLAAARGTIARLRADADRARASRSIVPEAGPGSSCPSGQACFDRAELEAGLGASLKRLRDRSRVIVDKSAEVGIALQLAREWAAGRK